MSQDKTEPQVDVPLLADPVANSEVIDRIISDIQDWCERHPEFVHYVRWRIEDDENGLVR